MELFGSIYLYS